ncbi:MAG: biopolymer transporter ExbD [Kofleriaceae bacterium]
MPVHVAGPRLYHSVKFKHLVKGAGAGATRASNISLNLVPFVDMMTILVTFLLMVFGTTGEILTVQKGLELPTVSAEQASALQMAPIITVSRSEIAFKGELVTTVDEVLADERPSFKIDQLFERLKSVSDALKEEISKKKDKDGRDLDPKLLKVCAEAKQGIRPQKDAKGNITICPDSLAILQADEQVDATVINKVVNTAKAAGFDNLLFAVKKK